MENIAVLFFSCSAEAESLQKHLHNQKTVQIASSLISHSRRQAHESGFPVYEFDEQHQQGQAFGERFANAFQKLYDQGFTHVIAIGNDSPGLKARHIQEAGQKLYSGQAEVVLGPARDGGAWLMGYSRRAFDAGSFKKLPWSTPNLLHAARKGSHPVWVFDEILADIDNAAGLLRFLSRYCNDPLLLPLVQLIRALVGGGALRFKKQTPTHLSQFAFSSNRLRAPPLAG